MKEEEEAVISNGMNDDDTNNINSCSEFDNNRIGDGDGDGDGDDNCNLNQTSQVWGTWEELVLTCAVKRHAFTDWDSVAKEVQVRSRSSLIVSAVNCRLKYQDLKRRFQDSVDGGEGNNEAAEDEVDEIPWLDQLRSLRVAELRREVERCDDSILSLQLKVKKLEEEKDGNDEDKKPDLGNDETKPAILNRETMESDREDNRSMNESNSTASVDRIADHERLDGDHMVQAYENSRNPDPDPVNKAATEEEEERTVSKRSEMSHSGELDESGTSTGPRKRKGQKYRSGGGGGGIKSAGNKSQPLIDIIKLIRSHPRGSVFDSRLRSQETKNYKSLIRQHLDIKSIEKKMEAGSYVSSSSLSFYRDLKLLFTNAIVFFPASSSEFMAAQELRTLVSNEMNKRTGKSGHSVIKTEAESSVSRQKSSVLPLVVCKKKNSASKKTSPSSSFKQKDERKTLEVSEEKTVTTTTTSGRSSRRTSKEIAVIAKDTKTGRAKNNNKKQKDTKTDSSNDDDDDKEETPKSEKKTVAVASDKKKSVADFLKRIKKNSPQKGKETTSKNQKKCDGNVKKEDDHQKKSDGNVKKDKAKPRELRSNSTGKKKAEVETNNKIPPKRKQTKEIVEATGKRGRESGKDNKQPKKRSRR